MNEKLDEMRINKQNQCEYEEPIIYFSFFFFLAFLASLEGSSTQNYCSLSYFLGFPFRYFDLSLVS